MQRVYIIIQRQHSIQMIETGVIHGDIFQSRPLYRSYADIVKEMFSSPIGIPSGHNPSSSSQNPLILYHKTVVRSPPPRVSVRKGFDKQTYQDIFATYLHLSLTDVLLIVTTLLLLKILQTF